MNVQRVLVVGAGQMGAGIAQEAARAGYQVYLRDTRLEFAEKGLHIIERNLAKSVDKGRLKKEEQIEILTRIIPVESWESAAQADLVIEAAPETKDIKRDIFLSLDQICSAHTILATNTSSLPITQIASLTTRPDRVIGMHFFNPVPVMKLVEIICGLETAPSVYETVRGVAAMMGKMPVRIEDYPGFAGNRIVMPMINEAIFTLMEGVASAQDIDQVLQLGFRHPMGPLSLADLIGLDTVLYIMEVLYEGYKDSKYRPCPLLRKKVQAGHLGRKSRQGFFKY